MMEIQQYIRAFYTIQDANSFLREKLALDIRREDLDFPDGTKEPVWVYNYNQIKSPKAHPMVIEARALILDKNADIVSMSFPRFFNLNEGPAAKIQYPDAIAEKKYDGSLVVVYSHKGEWFIQTRGTAQAQGYLVYGGMITFRQAILAVLEEKFGAFDPFLPFVDDENCYIFEFCSPYNRVVTPYKESDLVCLTIVNKVTQQEYATEIVDGWADQWGFKRPACFYLTMPERIDHILEMCETLEEGYVVVNPDKSRVKLKNPTYLAIARSINAGAEVSPRNFAEIVLAGERDEILSYFPEYSAILNLMHFVLEDIHDELDDLWQRHRYLEDQNNFALAIARHPFRHILFSLRKGKIESIDEGLKKLKPKHFVEYLKSVKKGQLERAFAEVLKYRN